MYQPLILVIKLSIDQIMCYTEIQFVMLKYVIQCVMLKYNSKFTSCQASYHVIHVILKQDHIRQS